MGEDWGDSNLCYPPSHPQWLYRRQDPGRQRPSEQHVSQAPHRNTLALPPLLILKVQKVVESQLGLTLIPRQCSATAEELAQPYALLLVWLQVCRVWGWGGFCPLPGDLTPWRGWCGVEGVSWHAEVTVLGLGTTWLCNSGLASPGHPASSERAVIQHTQVQHFPTSCSS